MRSTCFLPLLLLMALAAIGRSQSVIENDYYSYEQSEEMKRLSQDQGKRDPGPQWVDQLGLENDSAWEANLNEAVVEGEAWPGSRSNSKRQRWNAASEQATPTPGKAKESTRGKKPPAPPGSRDKTLARPAVERSRSLGATPPPAPALPPRRATLPPMVGPQTPFRPQPVDLIAPSLRSRLERPRQSSGGGAQARPIFFVVQPTPAEPHTLPTSASRRVTPPRPRVSPLRHGAFGTARYLTTGAQPLATEVVLSEEFYEVPLGRTPARAYRGPQQRSFPAASKAALARVYEPSGAKAGTHFQNVAPRQPVYRPQPRPPPRWTTPTRIRSGLVQPKRQSSGVYPRARLAPRTVFPSRVVGQQRAAARSPRRRFVPASRQRSGVYQPRQGATAYQPRRSLLSPSAFRYPTRRAPSRQYSPSRVASGLPVYPKAMSYRAPSRPAATRTSFLSSRLVGGAFCRLALSW